MYDTDSEQDVFYYQTQYKQHDTSMPMLDADLEYLGEDDVDILDLLTRAATKTSDLY